MMVALPPLNWVALEEYAPLLSFTVPVGVGLPEPPLTATFTFRSCAVVMLLDAGFTVTVGVTSCFCPPPPELALPPPQAAIRPTNMLSKNAEIREERDMISAWRMHRNTVLGPGPGAVEFREMKAISWYIQTPENGIRTLVLIMPDPARANSHVNMNTAAAFLRFGRARR